MMRHQPHSDWEPIDFLLFEAYQIYEDEGSTSHGLPIWMSRSGDPNLGFMVEESDDLADAALQKYDEEQGKKKSPRKGVSRYVVPVMLDGTPVPQGGLAREHFFGEMNKNTADRIDANAQSLLDDGLIERKPKGGYDPNEYG